VVSLKGIKGAVVGDFVRVVVPASSGVAEALKSGKRPGWIFHVYSDLPHRCHM
jgi:hypothetical protein